MARKEIDVGIKKINDDYDETLFIIFICSHREIEFIKFH